MSADPAEIAVLVSAALVRGERIALTTTAGDQVTVTYVPGGSWRQTMSCYLLRIGPPRAHKELVVFATAEEATAALIARCTKTEILRALNRFE